VAAGQQPTNQVTAHPPEPDHRDSHVPTPVAEQHHRGQIRSCNIVRATG
jgi:hypothetical protein